MAQTLQKNISWANEKYNGNIEESFYSIRDRFAFKYFENKIPVVVHGCCVLTNTLLYSKKCKIEAQFFQNPLHTMFFPPIKIVREQIKTREQSEFLMNNVFNEFNKMPVEVIANSTAKYLVVDFADIRWNFVEFTEPVNTRIILNNSPFLTLQSINEDNRFVFSKRHYTDIGLSEWESYVEKYIELAKKHFDVENIVLVRVPVAKYYIKNNEKIFFDKNDPELAFEGLLRKIEDMFINKIGNCKIVSLRGEPVANGLDDFGVTPLHLVKDVYIDLAKQLDSFVE